MAMLRMVCWMIGSICLGVDFCIRDAGEISLRDEQRLLSRPAKLGGIDRAG
jgi:hypothetical protein